jgi:hypothetical protein
MVLHGRQEQAVIKLRQWFRPYSVAASQTQSLALIQERTEHFIIWHQGEDEESIAGIAAVAEEAYQLVDGFFQYEPKSAAVLVVYPTEEELAAHFGWGKDESALGVYSNGQISILSPSAWMKPGFDVEELAGKGPIAHEYTHYVVDEITRGNYKRWWTEGLAQYLEKKFYGFQFRAPKTYQISAYYSLQDMEADFDALDQRQAYWQSLLAVEYIVEEYGEEGVRQMLQALSRGQVFHKALEKVWGISYDELEDNYRRFLMAVRGDEVGAVR